MPRGFNPGHRPSQPLYPDNLVYTTVAKVAAYLQLPIPDPITLSSDSAVNSGSIRIPVSGEEYRRWRFGAGDSVMLFDNADALGSTLTLTGVQSSGSAGVIWLLAADPGTAYTTANSAQVQLQNPITESAERGITKSHVERLIKQKQDYIDKITRMAWRPRLVVDEYSNFTTFKPYRRRYYTDYVGAVYLRNRMIRRIIRLGVWQGDYYRELAAARIRITVKDTHLLGGSDKIFLCPGANATATLQQGSSASQWKGEFGKKTVAGEIAMLINEDAAAGKSAIQIGSLTDGGSNLNISNEWLSTANSDEGDGKILLSSMRSTEDGNSNSIAFSNRNCFEGDLGTDTNATVSSVSAPSFTVPDASTFTGFHGLVYIEGNAGVNHVALCSRSDNTFTVVTDLTSSFNSALAPDVIVKQIRLVTDADDEERMKSWWSIEDTGMILFNNVYPFFENHSLKISYVFGERYLDKVIQDVCTKLVCIDVMLSDDYTSLFPEGTQNIDLNAKTQKLEEECKRALIPFQEGIIVAGMGG